MIACEMKTVKKYFLEVDPKDKTETIGCAFAVSSRTSGGIRNDISPGIHKQKLAADPKLPVS